MKKAISTLALALASAVTASAQLTAGSVAPDFKFKDLNGKEHQLYDYLNQGKTVFIDVSAAWCGPCWTYHKAGELETLWKLHGPTGGNGVNSSTTNDVMVLMIEAEATNTRAQLYGPPASGTYATQTQGDWVTGTLYPIIDTDAVTTRAFNSAWKVNFFPTVYMICRDRLVTEVGQQYASTLYAMSKADCPTTAPSSTVDVKSVPYDGVNAFNCSATPKFRFQNYSTTQNVTSATIKVFSGTTQVATQSWSGTLAPYGVQTVSMTSFSPTAFGPYKFEVSTTGDSYAGNNMSKDSLFKVYAPGNAAAAAWSENFEGSAIMPWKMTADKDLIRPFQSSGSYILKGTNGNTTRGLIIGFAEASAVGEKMEVVLGNFNTSANTNVALDFDLAHTMGTLTAANKLEVMVSKDCGATWTSVWSKTGAALATTTHTTGPFMPKTGADWRHESVLLTPHKAANMMLKVVGTAQGGHYAFMDNFKLTNSLDVNNVIAANDVKLFPNPAKDAATLELSLTKANNVTITVVDALGRTVSTVANGAMQQGQQRLSIATSALAAGVYTINIVTEEGALTQRLTVVK